MTYYNHDLTYPVPPNEAWDIQDPSKMEIFIDVCPRMYFFKYVLGWKSEAISNHLHFGTSWHEAQEYLLLNDYSAQNVMLANEIFLAKYREVFDEDTDEMFFPKTPTRAMLALAEYSRIFESDHRDFKVWEKEGTKMTEIAGTVHVNDEDVLHFRMDSILESEKGFFSIDHKTGSSFSAWGWEDAWNMKIQPNCYNHVLYSLFDEKDVRYINMRGTIFTKNKGTKGGKIFDFKECKVVKTRKQMQNWLWHLNFYIDQLKLNFDWLAESKPEDMLMRAFPMRTWACANYYGHACEYRAFCENWQNPLKRCETTPIGFEIEHWDPSKRDHSSEVSL